MAVMTAFDVKTRKLRLNTKCVTFGMPKFSCENFYKIYANSNIGILSVKKDHDPICHPVFMPTFKVHCVMKRNKIYLTLTRPIAIGLLPHAPVAQKIADQR